MAHKLTLSVAQLNEYVRRVLQLDPMLHGLCISGEISNLKLHQTGTIFFTLKDEQAAIACVMYPQAAQQLSAAPFEGMRVVVTGSVGLYSKTGQYQLYAEQMQPQGVGVLYERLMALRAKLSAQGLFDQERKRPLPAFPDTIGVVSSPTGAVIHDILSVSMRRNPDSRILLCPVRVQGVGSAAEVASAIALLEKIPSVSVIIVARGGGSIEDLWTFNEEEVVRAVAACKKPVVSAVGHETDVTLCDLAADLRAPTPSAAAECVVMEREAILGRIDAARKEMRREIEKRLNTESASLNHLRAQLMAMHPGRRLEAERARLMQARDGLRKAMCLRMEREGMRLGAARRELQLLSPYQVLSRGYAIVQAGGKVVTDVSSLSEGEALTIRFEHGSVLADVRSVTK